jgi:sterol 3beta-glucosyltransferase
MKISILAHGSRGDVQPPLVLAQRLIEAGHSLTVVVPEDFVPVAAGLRCRVVPLPRGIRAALDEGGLASSLRRGHSLRFFHEAFRHELVHLDRVFEAVLDGTEGAELIVAPALLEDLCISVAEARAQRVALLQPLPLWSNSTYPSFLFSAFGLPRWLNRFTHFITELGAQRITGLVNPARKRLGLRELRKRPSFLFRRRAPPVFYWAPERVLPRPAGYGDNHHFAGYFSPPPALRAAFGEGAPSAALTRFLDAGPPPLFAGFGSMPVLDARVMEAIEQATSALGVRVVYGQGWSETLTPDPRSISVREVDHDWLFPRCAAVLHHGGTSTTSAALRSGAPSIVASVFADQPFWGRRVVALGAGETFRFQKLSAERLKRALEHVLSEPVRRAAKSLADELAATPDGAVVATQHIDAHAADFPIPRGL